jgi:hypothetical protein
MTTSEYVDPVEKKPIQEVSCDMIGTDPVDPGEK